MTDKQEALRILHGDRNLYTHTQINDAYNIIYKALQPVDIESLRKDDKPKYSGDIVAESNERYNRALDDVIKLMEGE